MGPFTRQTPAGVRAERRCRLELEALEGRLLLDGSPVLMNPVYPTEPLVDGLDSVVLQPATTGTASTSGALTVSPTTYPLSSVPQLSSLPGAPISVYLNFTGDYEPNYGGFPNITTPAYDTDGDPTTFSAGELANIQQIWAYVAEAYAPFNINVTTIAPSQLTHGVNVEAVIGGDGAWTGSVLGGVSIIGVFSNPYYSDKVFIFPANLGSGTPRYVGDATAHEVGHSFGEYHQSVYDSSGNLLSEYNPGPGDGTAPIMGVSYNASRGLWWHGLSYPSGGIEDDLAVITSPSNGVTFRTPVTGSTPATADPLAVSGSQVSGSGVIATINEKDDWSFTTGAGQITISATVPATVGKLAAQLTLLDANGNVVATNNPAPSLNASITTTLPAGTYYAVVSSQGMSGGVGTYGSGYQIGSYQLSGTIVPPTLNVAAPTNLSATAVSAGEIDLAWTDNASNATGYEVDSSPDGVNWSQLGLLPATATSYADRSVSGGTTAYYRVLAFNGPTRSSPSNTATATTVPAAPANVTAQTLSETSVTVSWGDVTGENGFVVERSPDGSTGWTQVGTTSADVTNFVNTGLNPGTTYWYRIRAVDASGSSTPSTATSVTTTADVVATPTGLTGSANGTTNQVTLTWTDNAANATGTRVMRSVDGSTWFQLATLSVSGTGARTYVDSTASPGTTYYYAVQDFDTFTSSSLSNVATATTITLAPTNPVAKASSNTTIVLTWNNVVGEQGFKIERSLNNTVNWVQVGTTAANVTSYTDTGLTPNMTYYYRVRASDAAGDSAYSATAWAITNVQLGNAKKKTAGALAIFSFPGEAAGGLANGSTTAAGEHGVAAVGPAPGVSEGVTQVAATDAVESASVPDTQTISLTGNSAAVTVSRSPQAAVSISPTVDHSAAPSGAVATVRAMAASSVAVELISAVPISAPFPILETNRSATPAVPATISASSPGGDAVLANPAGPGGGPTTRLLLVSPTVADQGVSPQGWTEPGGRRNLEPVPRPDEAVNLPAWRNVPAGRPTGRPQPVGLSWPEAVDACFSIEDWTTEVLEQSTALPQGVPAARTASPHGAPALAGFSLLLLAGWGRLGAPAPDLDRGSLSQASGRAHGQRKRQKRP
jgi:hypothetical protein